MLGLNRISEVGAQHLADALKNNKVLLTRLETRSYPCLLLDTQKLTTMKLGWNQIGAIGAQHIAEALKHNSVTATRRFYLSYMPSLHIDTHQIGFKKQCYWGRRSTMSRGCVIRKSGNRRTVCAFPSWSGLLNLDTRDFGDLLFWW